MSWHAWPSKLATVAALIQATQALKILGFTKTDSARYVAEARANLEAPELQP
ncbi:hypothetical protein BH11MYX1_BH11MYX1_47880 [soil metagenome]